MIKASQNIIKKGDYYEYEPIEQLMPTQSKSKRQQTPIVSSTNLPVSQYITNEIPNFKQARNQYFFSQLPKQYQQKNIYDLKTQLYELLNTNEDNLKDQDRKEIQKLIEEIDMFKDSKEVPLLKFNDKQNTENLEAKKVVATNVRVNLTAKYNLNSIQSKVAKLQALDFPELQNLQHQLEVMIGQKKPLTALESLPKDYPKEQINNLYNHLNSLQILNSINLTIDKISLNEEKYNEMNNWVEKTQKATKFNHDFLNELKQDELLLNKLEENFKNNIQQVRVILKQLKK